MVTNNSWNSQDPVEVDKGGTGVDTLTDHALLVGSGTSPVTSLPVGTEGELLVGAAGADPAFGSSADADFTFTESTPASTRTLTVQNTDDTTGTSNANMLVKTTGGSGGDPSLTVQVAGTQSYSVGIDNSTSDELVITDSTGPSAGNKVFTISSAGLLNLPQQTSVFAFVSANVANVTGDGTIYTVIMNTERFDIGGDFNTTTGVFTTPITGKYSMNWGTGAGDFVVANNSMRNNLVTSNASYQGAAVNPFVSQDVPAQSLNRPGFVICDMDVGDTAFVTFEVRGGAKTVSNRGDAVNHASRVSIELVS